jgi:hypothetical protein
VFIGAALAGEPVGLAELEPGGHIIASAGAILESSIATAGFRSLAPPRARVRVASATAVTAEHNRGTLSGISPVQTVRISLGRLSRPSHPFPDRLFRLTSAASWAKPPPLHPALARAGFID